MPELTNSKEEIDNKKDHKQNKKYKVLWRRKPNRGTIEVENKTIIAGREDSHRVK
jgi:hypothetical protein